MDFSLTKDQKEYRREIIEFAKNQLNETPYLETFHRDLFKKAADFGLLGIVTDEKYGGLNEDYTTAAVAFEALGYGCKNNGLIFVINNHIWVCMNVIYLYGSERLKEKYISRMVQGEAIGAIAITEAEAGSDALNMTAHAEPEDDCYVLNGSKMFISNGPIADVFVVFAVTEKSPKKKLTAFVVERGFDGFSIGSDIEKMGLGACPTSEITFQNCRIPKENVIGEFNQGYRIMTAAIEWERCYEFVPHVGVMQRIMEQCINHVNTRKQFEKQLNQYQAVTHKIAQMSANIELAKLMMYKIAWLKDHQRSAFAETSIFKLHVSESYIRTCKDAMQIFGAYGYTKEYDFERELRDALASSIYSGTNEMQKNTIFNMAAMAVSFNH